MNEEGNYYEFDGKGYFCDFVTKEWKYFNAGVGEMVMKVTDKKTLKELNKLKAMREL